jgi:hypothetical protein
MPSKDPFEKLMRPLAACLIAVVASLFIAALIGGAMPLDYAGRAWVYAGCLLYVVAGAVVVFRLTAGAETAPLTPAYVLRWTIALWIWPALLWGRRR